MVQHKTHRAMRSGKNDQKHASDFKAAFDYIVGEKLLNFAEACVHNPGFARELPRFVSEVRLNSL